MDAIEKAKAAVNEAQAAADQAYKRLRAARREMFDATEAHEDAQGRLIAAERDARNARVVVNFPAPVITGSNAGARRARG